MAFEPFGEPEHVDGAEHAGLRRLDGVALVMDRACRAGEIVDLVDLDEEREAYIVAQQFEIRLVAEMGDIGMRAGEEIVDADDVRTVVEQLLAEV